MSHWKERDEGGNDIPYDPTTLTDEFGVPLHLYRTFQLTGEVETAEGDLLPGVKKFIERGGILWLGMQMRAWVGDGWSVDESTGKMDRDREESIQRYALRIRSLAPAKVFFACGWEPDGHSKEGMTSLLQSSGGEYGTGADYKAMYEHWHKRFEQYGVTNAVFLVDFSHKPLFKTKTAEGIKALMPSPDKVDWLFFNYFQYQDSIKWSIINTVKSGECTDESYVKGEGDCGQPHHKTKPNMFRWEAIMEDSNLMDPVWQTKPRGIGAWGTTYNQIWYMNNDPSEAKK
jgi:hypothetical protein